MRILWDLRLYSYAYKTRGVGVFTQRMITAIKEANYKHEIFIWGNPNDIPLAIQSIAFCIIPYKKSSWIIDLFTIPFIALRYNISLFHYWIVLGPIFHIGLGYCMPCKVCATLYDFAADVLVNDPYLLHIRNSNYWKVQKMILKNIKNNVCISNATKNQSKPYFSGNNSTVIYMPALSPTTVHNQRQKIFFTLGGALHKNIEKVVQGFYLFQAKHPEYTLAIIGEIQKDEILCQSKECLIFASIDTYEFYLKNAQGYICCSTYEGLGIPAIDAMSFSCPMVLSDIPVFHETCQKAARFVNAHSDISISQGIEDVAINQNVWIQNSSQGYFRYNKMCENSGNEWITFYENAV